MSTYAKVTAANRTKSRTLLVLGALYVVIGLGLSIVSAIAGEPLGAFLGFLIVSCTIGGTVLLRAVWRLNAQAAAITDRLSSLGATLARVERGSAEREKWLSDIHDGSAQSVDLAAAGRGDPSLLTAAVLDQATYPRLVKAMEDRAEDSPAAQVEKAETSAATRESTPRVSDTASPAEVNEPPLASGLAEAAVVAGEASSTGEAVPVSPVSPHAGSGQPAPARASNGKHEVVALPPEEPGPMSRVMMRRWKAAYREGDLPACREVFSVFEPIADADLVHSMRQELDEVIERTERRLRLQFQQLVHEQRFGEALRVGEEMMRMLPDRPIAEEFARIKPHLQRRASSYQGANSG